MICAPSNKTFKWVRADGGWDLGQLMFANGCAVTSTGLIAEKDLDADDQVLVKTACDGPLWFVEFGRLEAMPVREE